MSDLCDDTLEGMKMDIENTKTRSMKVIWSILAQMMQDTIVIYHVHPTDFSILPKL